jgi:hypothetical protein
MRSAALVAPPLPPELQALVEKHAGRSLRPSEHVLFVVDDADEMPNDEQMNDAREPLNNVIRAHALAAPIDRAALTADVAAVLDRAMGGPTIPPH